MKQFSREDLKRALKKEIRKAEMYLKDDRKMEKLLQDFEAKVHQVPKVGRYAADIATMISMIRAYSLKQYTVVPRNTILSTIGVLIYVVDPIDLIPDVIPAAGLIDDAGVIAVGLEICHRDIEEYRKWQIRHGKRKA